MSTTRLVLIILIVSFVFSSWILFAATPRSSKWPAVRNAYIKAHPTCAACGRKATEVHHILPFHDHPELELDPDNLIALCDRDHLLLGHLDSWLSWNPNVRTDAAIMLNKIQTRPRDLPAAIAEHATTPTLILSRFNR
jgi:hypothetical protein